MRIAHLTPGTGSFYCGSCVRDHALVSMLRRMGHDAVLVPLYLPIVVDRTDAIEDASESQVPLFYGGVNVYLQQKMGIFRHTPRWLDQVFDCGLALEMAASRAGMTDPGDLGELTLSMLRGPNGRQAKELGRLVDWLENTFRPEVVALSNTLLSGVLGELRRRLDVPLIASVQGEDTFVNQLGEPWREEAWKLLRQNCHCLDAVVAPSNFYAARMRDLLAIPAAKMHMIADGVPMASFSPAEEAPSPPVIGYLARLCPEKGLDTLVEAFIRLRRERRDCQARLHVAGTMTPADEAFVQRQRERLAGAGLAEEARISPNVERREKLAYLSTLSVLSVPTRIEEAFGLYVIEAMASGVPVVEPRRGALAELVEQSGGGLLYDPTDPAALVAALDEMVRTPEAARRTGLDARHKVMREFSTETMAGRFAILCEALVKQPHA